MCYLLSELCITDRTDTKLPEKHDFKMAKILGGKETLSTHTSTMIPYDNLLRRKEQWVVKQRERTKNILI